MLWFLLTHFSCKDRNLSWISELSWEETLLHTVLHSEIFEVQWRTRQLRHATEWEVTKWMHKSFILDFWGKIPNLDSRIFRSWSPGWGQHTGIYRGLQSKEVSCKASWGFAARLTTSLGSEHISKLQGYISGKKNDCPHCEFRWQK